MADTQATFFATLVDEWARCGLTDAVLAPGQRSTLLAAQLEAEPRIRTHVVVDERSASYFALGLGLATGRPALMWCTSGTATAEVHAAVIEAHQARVPLLVCTANRPPELHHARDWQSTDQSRLYGGATRWHFEPGVAAVEMRDSWRSIAARSLHETVRNPLGPGPVHLDLAIREPWSLDLGPLPEGRADGSPWHVHHAVSRAAQPDVVDALVAAAPGRGAIMVGRSDVDPVVLHECAEALGWPVLADVRSGCRTDRPNTVAAFDALLRSEAFMERHRPDVVLRIGNPLMSKLVPQWVQRTGAVEWLVDPFDEWTGSVPAAAHIVQTDPTALCRAVTERLQVTSSVEPPANEPPAGWLDAWRAAERSAQAAIAEVLDGRMEVDEPGVARALVAELPDGANLFAATSMPVRDVEWYAAPRDGITVLANRGASGMDGLTSTAAAVALASQKPTVLLIGDLSFLYDLNALWALRGAAEPVDLTIVLVDNNGGGVFSGFPNLRSLGSTVFERVVATPQDVDIPDVAESLGATVEAVGSMESLMPAVRRALDEGGIRLVHVQTDRAATAALREQIHAAVAASAV